MLIEMKSCRWESWGSQDQDDHPPCMHLEKSLITPVQDEPLFRIIKILWVSLLNPVVMFFCFFCRRASQQSRILENVTDLHASPAEECLSCWWEGGGQKKKCSLIMQWIPKPNVTRIHPVNGLQTGTNKQTGVPALGILSFSYAPDSWTKCFLIIQVTDGAHVAERESQTCVIPFFRRVACNVIMSRRRSIRHRRVRSDRLGTMKFPIADHLWFALESGIDFTVML